MEKTITIKNDNKLSNIMRSIWKTAKKPKIAAVAEYFPEGHYISILYIFGQLKNLKTILCLNYKKFSLNFLQKMGDNTK